MGLSVPMRQTTSWNLVGMDDEGVGTRSHNFLFCDTPTFSPGVSLLLSAVIRPANKNPI